VLRGLLNDVPTALLLSGTVVVVVLLVLGGVWLLRRRFPTVREGFDAEVSSQMLGSIAALFGLLLAFVIVVEFENFQAAESSVSQEADDLAALVRDSDAFRPADGARLRAAAGYYARAVVNEEWQRMEDGHASDRAWDGVDRMHRALRTIQPTSPQEIAFYQASVRELSDLVAARRDRLDTARGGLPVLLGALIIFGSLVIVTYASLVGSRSFTYHAIGAVAIAVLIAFSLVVLLDLSFPFSGDFSIEPDPFHEGSLARFFP
jgi:hypothetical protein